MTTSLDVATKGEILTALRQFNLELVNLGEAPLVPVSVAEHFDLDVLRRVTHATVRYIANLIDARADGR